MTAIYAIATVLGLGGLVVWTLMRGFGLENTRFDPEARFGTAGRLIVSGTAGFGLGGMSSTFAGWTPPLAIVAAVGGGIAVALLTRALGPQRETP